MYRGVLADWLGGFAVSAAPGWCEILAKVIDQKPFGCINVFFSTECNSRQVHIVLRASNQITA